MDAALSTRHDDTSHALVSRLLATPIGQLTLVASARGLAAVLWEKERPGRVPLPAWRSDDDSFVLREAGRQLTEYFEGRRQVFDVPLDVQGTPFQLDVWEALRAIPYGETQSYRDVAARIGRPRAVRAVGAANGRNPVSIITPCHRVIGANGALTGFAAGLDVKARLLELERHAARLF